MTDNINLLPCPFCGRRITRTKINELNNSTNKINNSTQFITLPDKKLTDSIGNTVYYCYQGEIVECVCCDVRYDFDRKVWDIYLATDDKIFPYREPIAGFDDDQTDWCVESITEPIERFNDTIFITREEAEKSLSF